MDWHTYKTLSDHPLYWTRWMLEQCVDLLRQMQEQQLAGYLQAALRSPPLPVPEDHFGPDATRMFAVQLSIADGKRMLEAMQHAEQQGLYTSATAGRGLGGFVAAWAEYGQAQKNMDLLAPLSICKE
ncbi:MAG: hypothetical protein V2I41_04625 [Pseudomonadales bacterium]|jgi:hypothetical protein|nr:hypothetical protein [Pseudomonadales bacterium]